MAVDYMGSLIDPLAKVQQGQDYVTKMAQYGTQRQAGSQYATGDYRGAATTLARGGDIAGAVGVQRSEAERLTMQQAYIKQALPVFQAALQRGGPEAVVNAYQQIAPDLKRIGMSDEEIAQFGQRLQADPKGTIEGLAPFAQGKWEFRDGGNGQVLVYRDGQYVRTDMGRFQKGREGEVILDYGEPGQGTQRETPLVAPAVPPTGGAPPPPAAAVGSAAAAQMPAAPVPPQTAAAPVASPQLPAAGAVQPLPPVAMAPDPQPPRPGIPPPDAPVVNQAAFGPRAQATPEGPRIVTTIPRQPKPPTAASGFSAAMTDDAVEYAANQYMLTGKMPPLGAGAAGARAQIIAKAAQIAKARGLSFAQVAGSQAERTSNASALTQIVKYTNMSEGFAETMRKAANYATTLLDKGAAQSGSPLVNRGIQWWRTNVKGDADVAAFNTAINTLTTEYAKVMTGNTGAAGATEGAREHARELLNTAQTPEQFRRAVEVLNTEVRLRREALLEQAAALRSALNTAGQSTSHTPAARPAPATSSAPRRPLTDAELLRKYGAGP